MKAWVGMGVLALLLGCGGAPVEDVQQKYTSRVRQLGLIPVYPPREGVQVGDIFISSNVPHNDAKTLRFAVGSVPDMLDAAEQTLRGRVVFEASQAKDSKSPPDTDRTRYQADFRGGDLKTRGENGAANVALPIEVFPEITADAGSSLNYGILASLTAKGLFSGTRTSVTLNFDDVRSYWVDPLQVTPAANKALCLLMSPTSPEGTAARALLASGVADRDAPGGPNPNRREALTLITKVYLTRTITYTYRNAKLLAAARQVLTAEGKPRQGDGKGVTVNILPPFDAGKSPAPSDETIASIIDGLRSGNDGTSFVSFNALGLTIKRTFRQPVVIAYEGLSYPTVWTGPEMAPVCDAPGAGILRGARPSDVTRSAPAKKEEPAKTF